MKRIGKMSEGVYTGIEVICDARYNDYRRPACLSIS
jgi:hypothetical protein